MKEILILAIALILILAVVFITAKGEKKKVRIISEEPVEVEVEIANNSLTWAKGLMGRSHLGENEGMLFVFPDESKRGFWMVNTTIALDAIHFSKNMEIVDIISMDPCISCKTHYPRAPSQYVLEVNKGFASSHNLKIGDKMVLE